MPKPNVILRADGNAQIGLGHVYRCLAIAERLSANFNFYFAIQNPSSSLATLISSHCIVISLKETNDYTAEAAELLNLLNKEKIDVVVLDGYNFDTEYQQTIKSRNVCLVCIDDHQIYPYEADVVINHADGISEEKVVRKNPEAKLYLGFKYALLRKPFINLRRLSRQVRHLSNLFICFGGSDQSNITLKVLNAATSSGLFEEINVIIGSSNENWEHTYLAKSYSCKINFHRNLSTQEMVELMSLSELAIVPASTISMECRTAGMAIITGTTADNQQNILNGMASLSHVKPIGDFITISEAQLAKEIDSFVQGFTGYTHLPEPFLKDPILEIFENL